MNINSLKYFNKIAKAGNISSVAREEYITQSALSQQIRKLESDFGHPLMERSNKGAKLTPVGEIVFRHSENILRSHDGMLKEIEDFINDNKNLKIAACPSIADYAVPCTLMLANKEFNNHKYELSTGNASELHSGIENNLYDIVFTFEDHKLIQKYCDLNYVTCGKSEIMLLAKNDDKVPDEITVDELLDTCLITLAPASHITKSITNKLSEHGYKDTKINCNLEVQSIESAKKIITRELGMAFLPYISVKEELYKKQLKQVKVKDFDINLDIVMVSKKNHSPYIEDFINWFLKSGKNTFC
jgi:DNA-binding transcriptional LysR family regulator